MPTTGLTPADLLKALDPWWLFLSLIPGGMGFVLFVYGKKQQRWTLMAFGVAFTAYPYFTQTIPSLVVVGTARRVARWLAMRGGW